MTNPVKIDEVVCTGCRACIESCPTDVLRMNEEKGKAYVAFPEDCQVCFLCEFDCPVDAIFVTASKIGESELAHMISAHTGTGVSIVK
jgi:NAD-dependent dihydropyrimidine dehydrogenase PreA subunit